MDPKVLADVYEKVNSTLRHVVVTGHREIIRLDDTSFSTHDMVI